MRTYYYAVSHMYVLEFVHLYVCTYTYSNTYTCCKVRTRYVFLIEKEHTSALRTACDLREYKAG
jgi:hypothetical protein